jgi:hypothetical protein
VRKGRLAVHVVGWLYNIPGPRGLKECFLWTLSGSDFNGVARCTCCDTWLCSSMAGITREMSVKRDRQATVKGSGVH